MAISMGEEELGNLPGDDIANTTTPPFIPGVKTSTESNVQEEEAVIGHCEQTQTPWR